MAWLTCEKALDKNFTGAEDSSFCLDASTTDGLTRFLHPNPEERGSSLLRGPGSYKLLSLSLSLSPFSPRIISFSFSNYDDPQAIFVGLQGLLW